ncbi:MAG: septal ring lytic transglycosylase RlpA family protein [Dokdonella sp.]
MRLRAAACLTLGALLAACAGHAPKRGAPPTPASSPPASGPRRASLPPDTARPQSERYRQNSDNGPAAPPIDVSKIPEPVPKVEPRSRFGNKQTYSVLGRSYSLLPSASGYVERGIASWYGNKFHGYMTSSFETYDMYAFSAAHKTLPLPSYARVTNLDNGKSVVVRINDRGPFHENRLIDLSYAAAVKIGVWPKGTGVVEVRAIDPAHPDAQLPATQTARTASNLSTHNAEIARFSPRPATRVASATPPMVSANAPRIYVQLGSFGERSNAERAAASATRAGLDHVDIQSIAVAGHTLHRVRVGPIADAEAADALTERIQKLGLGAPRVAIEH